MPEQRSTPAHPEVDAEPVAEGGAAAGSDDAGQRTHADAADVPSDVEDTVEGEHPLAAPEEPATGQPAPAVAPSLVASTATAHAPWASSAEQSSWQSAWPHPDPSRDAFAGSAAADTPTERIAVWPHYASGPPRRRGVLIGIGAAVAALGLLYGGDLASSAGSVPRGVVVAGVPVGGLALADAEQLLRQQIEPRTTRPVPVTAGTATAEVNPRSAGLAVDWAATLGRAGSQPLDPITRLTSFFTSREISVVTTADQAALGAALTRLAPAVDVPPVEGGIRFDGTTPQPINPSPGERLDVSAAAAVLTRDWASGRPVALPVTPSAPVTTPEAVAKALETVARPAVSAPVTVSGENGAQAALTPAVVARALSFRADPAAGLVPVIDQKSVTDALRPQLAPSERPGRDASLDFSSGTPVVVPSLDGRGVDYPATLKDLLAVLTRSGQRQLAAVYVDQPAKLTTAEVTALGISGVIGEFTTRGFAADSGLNIKRAAEQLDGTIIRPGATFSLNAATNPRDEAHGYVEAGIIDGGRPSRGVGGGVSQVATTLYNAAYFAGMTDVQHHEHSFYISRYPPGREATVFDNAIDLKFRNDNPTGVMIRTAWTPSSITVRIFGTKRYEVTSTPGPRTNPTPPPTVTVPAGEPCSASRGAPGFTITDTRTLREVATGQVRSESRTVAYNPSPVVVCAG